MSLLRVELELSRWWSPDQQKKLFEITGTSFDFQGRASDPKENAPDWEIASTQRSQTLFDNGSRQIMYGKREAFVHATDLHYVLPCQVLQVHSTKTIDNFEARGNTVINQKVRVAVPGNSLLDYDRVQLELDCCTDHLQDQLSAGWRIIAICVQPDQRRPDYILGKKSELSFPFTPPAKSEDPDDDIPF